MRCGQCCAVLKLPSSVGAGREEAAQSINVMQEQYMQEQYMQEQIARVQAAEASQNDNAAGDVGPLVTVRVQGRRRLVPLMQLLRHMEVRSLDNNELRY